MRRRRIMDVCQTRLLPGVGDVILAEYLLAVVYTAVYRRGGRGPAEGFPWIWCLVPDFVTATSCCPNGDPSLCRAFGTPICRTKAQNVPENYPWR